MCLLMCLSKVDLLLTSKDKSFPNNMTDTTSSNLDTLTGNGQKSKKPSHKFIIFFFITIIIIIILWTVLTIVTKKPTQSFVANTNVGENTAVLTNIDAIEASCCPNFTGYYIPSIDAIVSQTAPGFDPSTYCINFTSCRAYEVLNPGITANNSYCQSQGIAGVTTPPVVMTYAPKTSTVPGTTTVVPTLTPSELLQDCCNHITECIAIASTTTTTRSANAAAFRGSQMYYITTGGDSTTIGPCNIPYLTCIQNQL